MMNTTLRTQEVARHLKALEGTKALPLDAFVQLCNWDRELRREQALGLTAADWRDAFMARAARAIKYTVKLGALTALGGSILILVYLAGH